MKDGLSALEPLLAARRHSDPWQHDRDKPPVYAPDFELLEQLLSVPVREGSAPSTGRFALAVDAWLAHELRRAGFGADEVWPRAGQPRILPREVAELLNRLPVKLADELRERILKMPSIAPTSARVLGRAYEKQVDVLISRWDRGPELLISTKSQVSGFGKNLPNRFEEAYGDAGNLRARYPLAAVGFFFVQRATVLRTEPDAFERTVDMMRKLRDLPVGVGAGNGYTATGLVLVDWDAADSHVRIVHEAVPEDVAAPQFLARMVDAVLAVTPIQHHVAVRGLRERRTLRIREDEGALDLDFD
ncbi:hypothetical protein [Sporichthya polymorpha]|uniref:hypothetical protein n=1 Tax=Sporichthya polymorpha TaxID=35751 RepID=UPI0003824661|nr:hypothetical protein [Sporichthya polymorpha]